MVKRRAAYDPCSDSFSSSCLSVTISKTSLKKAGSLKNYKKIDSKGVVVRSGTVKIRVANVPQTA